MTVVDLNARRAPVVYTVTIAHHYDDTLEFRIEDVADDPRSRDAVMDAFRRISGAADRIEKLEAALQDIARGKCSGFVLTSIPPKDPAVERAKQALEGKDD